MSGVAMPRQSFHRTGGVGVEGIWLSLRAAETEAAPGRCESPTGDAGCRFAFRPGSFAAVDKLFGPRDLNAVFHYIEIAQKLKHFVPRRESADELGRTQ